VEIFTCDDDGPPPVHITSRTHCVATLSLDLDKIPSSVKKTAKQIKMGWYKYYCLEGAIEASYGSAMITYSVQLGGERILCDIPEEAQTDINLGVTHDVISVRYE
jgi:hypothetical protein